MTGYKIFSGLQRSDINWLNSRRGRLARRAVSKRSTMPKARAMVSSGFRK
jgi:hypothetical protein